MDLESSDGFPTSTMYGVLSSLKSVLSRFDVDSVTGVFDGGHAKRRVDLHENYKNRKDRGGDNKWVKQMYNQIELLHNRYLPDLGVASIMHRGHEADDLIYLLSEIVNDTAIYSGDKDFFQCINEDNLLIKAVNSGKDEVWDHSRAREELEVDPDQYDLYLALVGDQSDGISGVDGIGEKRAEQLVNEYGSLDAIRRDDSEPEYKYEKSLRSSLDRVERNIKLIDLDQHTFPAGSISTIKESIQQTAKWDMESFADLVRSYDMDSLWEEKGKFYRLFYDLSPVREYLKPDWEEIIDKKFKRKQ